MAEPQPDDVESELNSITFHIPDPWDGHEIEPGKERTIHYGNEPDDVEGNIDLELTAKEGRKLDEYLNGDAYESNLSGEEGDKIRRLRVFDNIDALKWALSSHYGSIKE